ncbi:hypothetical protein A7K73_00660 [Candidatus Methylacidiphilum fumarolicum]|nr:hypothetical protein A7K73_00660 [Candidatus Methylacidiphilum fumarolicum]TFE73511.1 hypothetical protein A7K72_06300 [Candidatus Methylacidiphilum fumarolicum]
MRDRLNQLKIILQRVFRRVQGSDLVLAGRLVDYELRAMRLHSRAQRAEEILSRAKEIEQEILGLNQKIRQLFQSVSRLSIYQIFWTSGVF